MKDGKGGIQYDLRMVERDTPFELILAGQPRWIGFEFGDITAADFTSWWRRSGQPAVLTGFEAQDVQERIMQDLIRDYRRIHSLPWIDLPENEDRVADHVLRHRMGYQDLLGVRAGDVDRVRKAVAAYRWEGKRLRRQSLSEEKVVYAANTIYARVIEPTLTDDDRAHYKALRNERPRREVAADQLSDYTAEVVALLRGERWRDWTYNAVAEATWAPWQRAKDTLDWLARRREHILPLVVSGQSFRLVRTGERATHYRYCPEFFKLRKMPKPYVLGEIVWRLALENGSMSKRDIRRAVRRALLSANNPAVDAAIALLVEYGLLTRSGHGNGSPSGYTAETQGAKERRKGLLASLLATVPPPCQGPVDGVPPPCQ